MSLIKNLFLAILLFSINLNAEEIDGKIIKTIGKYFESVDCLSFNAQATHFQDGDLLYTSYDTIYLKKDLFDTVLNYKIKINRSKNKIIYNNRRFISYNFSDLTKNIQFHELNKIKFTNYLEYFITIDDSNYFSYLIYNPELFNISTNLDTIYVEQNIENDILDLKLRRNFKIYNEKVIEFTENYLYALGESNYTKVIFSKYNDSIFSDNIFDETLDGFKENLISPQQKEEENIELKLRDKFINKEFYTNSIKNLNGQDVKIENNGKHKIIFFWGSWCGACKLAFKPLKEFIDSNDKKFEVIAISVKEPNDTNQLKYITGKDFPFTFLKNGDLTADYYGLTSYPSFVILNKDFKIEDFAIGYFDNFKDYLQYIKNELK